jgi:hypothetical protein
MIRDRKWRAIARGIIAIRKTSQIPVYLLAALNHQFDVSAFTCEDPDCCVTIRGPANIADWHASHRTPGHRVRKTRTFGLTGTKDILVHCFDRAYLRKHFMLAHSLCNLRRARSEACVKSVLDPYLITIRKMARKGLRKIQVYRKLRLDKKKVCSYSNFATICSKRRIIFKKKIN